MTTATSPRSSTKSRSSRSGTADNDRSVPVLLRLPNLRPERTRTKPERTTSSEQSKTIPTAEDAASKETRGQNRRRDSSSQERAKPQTNATRSQVLGLVWRVGIVAAAIALIVLAYRIINGPPAPSHVSTPDASDVLLTDVPKVSEGQLSSQSGENVLAEPPKVVTPEFSFPEATPLRESQITGTEFEEGRDSEFGDSGAEEMSQIAPPLDTPPLANDGSSPTPFSTSAHNTWSEAANDGDDWQDSDTDSWVNRDNLVVANDDVPRNVSNAAGYPESDPQTWRTAEQWFFAAEQAALEEGQAAPPWQEGQRSAAHLRPEIEQPPLPRERLR